MKKLLALAATGEAAMGAVLLVCPPIVVWLLFGGQIAEAGVIVSRIAGVALIALGVACWPGRTAYGALRGMLVYSSLAALYLAYLGIRGDWIGILLWPAVALHAILTFFLARAWLKDRQTKGTKEPIL